MGTILDWFRTRREASIIKGTKEHAKKVYDSVYELNNVVKLIIKGKEKEASPIVKKIDELDHECDALRRKIMLELTKGELTPNVREDLAHLIKRLDGVATNANVTASRLGLLTSDVITPIMDDLTKMSEITLKCVELLYKTISTQLGESSQTVFESINKISKLEHDADEIGNLINQKLIKLEVKYSPYIAITIFDMVNAFERISDFAENTADLIKMINIRQ